MEFVCTLWLTHDVNIEVPAGVFLSVYRAIRSRGIIYRLSVYCCCDHYLSHRHYILSFGDDARGCNGFFLNF